MSLWTDLMGHQFEVRQVDVKGVTTRSLRMGSGTPVIFLHGISGHLEAFVRSAPYHAEHFDVHLIDMLGHGYTGKPGGAYTIDRLAQHVIDYMDVHGFEKAHVCGISLGGWTTGWLLARHADRMLRSTIMLAPGKPGASSPEIRERIIKSTTDAVMSDDREYTRKRLENVIHKKELVTDELVDVRYTIYHKPDLRAALPDILALTKPEISEPFILTPDVLGSIDQEVLLAWSEEDVYSEVAGAQYFADHLKNSRLAVFADAGHWPPYERPDAFSKVNIDFLKNGLAGVPEGVI